MSKRSSRDDVVGRRVGREESRQQSGYQVEVIGGKESRLLAKRHFNSRKAAEEYAQIWTITPETRSYVYRGGKIVKTYVK